MNKKRLSIKLLRRFHSARYRMLPWLKRRGGKVAVALVSRRLAVTVFMALLAVEMTVLGVGLSRRLELANKHSLEVSEAELAVIEARTLAESMQGKSGAAGIAASQSVSQDAPAEDDPDAPPPLRPRDVETILAQEAGDADWGDDAADNPNAAAVVKESSGAADTQNDALTEAAAEADMQDAAEAVAPTPLSRENRIRVDELIRRGVKEMVAGDMRACILTLEEARGISPDHPALLYYFGLAYDKLLNPRKAQEFYTQVFRMRGHAGKFFERASHRLTYGFDQPSAMRGKLSFGPYQISHTYDEEAGEKVDLLLPVLLAPGEEVRPNDIYIFIQFFDLVNGRKIEFARMATPKLAWQNETPTWKDFEENLKVTYEVPALSQEELDAYGDLKYYGFTAKLYYKEEPLDCISSPSALILQEQRLNNRRRHSGGNRSNSLLPDDGLDSTYEEALPVSDFLEGMQ